jgi:eukaryotic-like serine/threonine-protein kinase
VAREVCQRRGVKAMLEGSIASLGSEYLITLDAVNCANGESLATEQIQATRKEDVISRLGVAASALREQLGESLASIEKFDVPVEDATTPSLDALKSYSTAIQLHSAGEPPEKIVAHLDRAVTLDPQFALAHALLGTVYSNARELGRAREFSEKAYALRERITERERFYIETRYYDSVTGEMDEEVRVYRLWAETYPRDFTPWNNLGVVYENLGEPEKSLEVAIEALRLDPASGIANSNIAFSYLALNRLSDAKAAADSAIAKFPNDDGAHATRLLVACREQDAAKIAELVALGRKRGTPDAALLASLCAIRHGRFSDARELQREGLQLGAGLREQRTRSLLDLALAEWRLGDRSRAQKLALEASASLPEGALPPVRLPFVLAQVGETERAERVAAQAAAAQPKSTLVNHVWLPIMKSVQALAANRAGEAVELLRPAERYERRWSDITVQRSLAEIAAGNHTAAAAILRRFIDQESLMGPSPSSYPLALVTLARALTATGDIAGARRTYQQFLELWKHADADLSLLVAAHKELAALP